MKKFVFLAVVLVAIAGAVDANAGADVRLGGGMIFDGSVLGGGAAADIGIGEYPIALTPFLAYYKDSGVSQMPIGLNITYKAEVADGKANVHIGAGAGMNRVDLGGGLGSETPFLIDGAAGLTYGITDQMGIFGEVNYYYAKKSGVEYLNDVGAMIGISFKLGGK